ncbi:MAG: glycerate kinase [Clostridiales bacterium]|nr:glycerate kinase [Clostridiales bacterium]MBD9199993.1 glycerate kinase [Clostridiales bacterium]
MKKCIVISDSFKGSLSSGEICDIARACFAEVLSDCELTAIPVADGGEGTVDCFHQVCGGELVPVTVQGPFGQDMEASYLRLDGGRAVIEMASSAGLPLVGDRRDPRITSTYGVGQQIRHAVEQGSTQILLGLGGSCTNDGGCGCAAALGVRFLDRAGQAFVPTGGTLDQIAHIDVSGARQLLQTVNLTAMCDIDNPMHGPTGASYIFGPQKGADPAMVEFLDGQLKALDAVIQRELHRAVADVPGAGAAGAFGAGILAFLDGTLCPGIEAVLDLVDFDGKLKDCDLVITGEGRFDSQSIRGKVVSGVSRRAKRQGVPVAVIAGSVAEDVESVSADPDSGVTAAFSINRQAMDYSESRPFSRRNYRYTLENLLRLMKSTHG